MPLIAIIIAVIPVITPIQIITLLANTPFRRSVTAHALDITLGRIVVPIKPEGLIEVNARTHTVTPDHQCDAEIIVCCRIVRAVTDALAHQ